VTEPSDMPYDECVSLLASGKVGRVALSTPMGPRIVPVDYAVAGDSLIFRTPPHSLLGTYAQNTNLAFEVAGIDAVLREGWSVVVVGRASRVENPDEVRRLEEEWSPSPRTGGRRALYFRMPWAELTGSRLGDAVA
jgi:nitroimidazol reductase NimA-like FMN-containing flavoprotein (pyridoxamine 5'-phosphate oxidase superfamily)